MDIVEKEYIAILIKFGPEEFMTDLYENGTVYFNSIENFRKLEEQESRGDNYEGTNKIRNLDKNSKAKVSFHLPSGNLDIIPSRLHFREFLTEMKGNIYCMYAIKKHELKGDGGYIIDGKMRRFGTHFVLICKPKIFIDKIISELDRREVRYHKELIEYYDADKISGDVGLFRKRMQYEYQKEYRIVLYLDTDEPLKISIGSMEEYAELHEFDPIEVKTEINEKS